MAWRHLLAESWLLDPWLDGLPDILSRSWLQVSLGALLESQRLLAATSWAHKQIRRPSAESSALFALFDKIYIGAAFAA